VIAGSGIRLIGERWRQIARWVRSPTAPTTMSRTTLSNSWNADPRASRQLEYAIDMPTEAAAGMVVTEGHRGLLPPQRTVVGDAGRRAGERGVHPLDADHAVAVEAEVAQGGQDRIDGTTRNG
jgi:hypothetical protein